MIVETSLATLSEVLTSPPKLAIVTVVVFTAPSLAPAGANTLINICILSPGAIPPAI